MSFNAVPKLALPVRALPKVAVPAKADGGSPPAPNVTPIPARTARNDRLPRLQRV